jgi:ubiquinone/menaquinone biosynthesis C-methylase UbiE
MAIFKNFNEEARQSWLKKTLQAQPEGASILDAGAGELRNKKYCTHLNYTSQDFCQYKGESGGAINEGLQDSEWDTSRIDVVSDIEKIPLEDESFDVVLCSEVLEHVPEPTHALDEFVRLLRPGGQLILTAPFASLVHMAPFHYCSGFSRYWYEHHLLLRGFEIIEIEANGDWFDYVEQEVNRVGSLELKLNNWSWPIGFMFSILGSFYFKVRGRKKADDLACFGWHVVANKI